MTLRLKPDLDILNVYLQTKEEVSKSRRSKIRAWTDRQTHRQMRLNTLPRRIGV